MRTLLQVALQAIGIGLIVAILSKLQKPKPMRVYISDRDLEDKKDKEDRSCW